MAFDCNYDTALTDLYLDGVIEKTEIEIIENAINELKTYLNDVNNYNANISDTVSWGLDASLIDHNLVGSTRELVDAIDPLEVCTCDVVCTNDNECACNAESNVCTCETVSHCSPDCNCNNVYTT